MCAPFFKERREPTKLHRKSGEGASRKMAFEIKSTNPVAELLDVLTGLRVMAIADSVYLNHRCAERDLCT